MQQDEVSLGPIADDETIVRGALDPRHWNAKDRKIKAAVIRKKDLFSGNLSVWRVEPHGISLAELVERLGAVPEQRLAALCGISARDIRSIEASGARAFSVVDECDCDRDGNKHPAHAHIALCKSLIANGVDLEHPEFEQVRTELHARFTGSRIWENNDT